MSNNNVEDFYRQVKENSHLRTEAHARRWTDAVLSSLGLQLDRGTKKSLARELPKELADSLTRVFWLVHFRNRSITSLEFQNQVARRAGNSDIRFARVPILGVFSGVREMITPDLDRKVTDTLAPELRELWLNGN